MENERLPQSSRTRLALGLLAGLAALAVPAGAWAGTEAAALGVSLTVTESCQVDSTEVVAAGRLAELPRPGVRCGFAAPSAIRVTREPYLPVESAVTGNGTATPASAVVVTLTF